MPRFRVNFTISAHQPGQLANNGQSEAKSGVVVLAVSIEGVEDLAKCRRVNALAVVPYLKDQLLASVR